MMHRSNLARQQEQTGSVDSMATLMTETEHAAFMAEARLRLTTLKERAVKRARFRGDAVVQPADRDALAGQQPNGGLGERHSDAQTPTDARPAGAALQRLIAAMLLDATTAVPIDSAKLHREARSFLATALHFMQTAMVCGLHPHGNAWARLTCPLLVVAVDIQ